MTTVNVLSKWSKRFLEMATLVASWSKDSSTKVGAVISDSNKKVVSVGFNGFPMLTDDNDLPRERKLLRTIHAELNAILTARRSVEGCTIHITAPPCSQCAAAIVQSGITKVIFYYPENGFAERWALSTEEAGRIFEEAGVDVVCFKPAKIIKKLPY